MSFFSFVEEAQSEDLISSEYLPLHQKLKKKDKKKKVIVISGPTGVGKTALSLSIAESIGGEIISADSMQIYRGMDIGTAKVSKGLREKIPHHLIDICDINEDVNVVTFYEEAHKACKDIIQREKVPIVVGGSGFYIRVFLYGPPKGPASSPEIRQQLEHQLEVMGADVLYERLQMLDPQYAKTITEHDKHKIVRALEIIALTNRPVSEIPIPPKVQEGTYDYRNWFLYRPKEDLYPLVEKRCDEMIAKGFIEEVKRLDLEGLRKNYSASQAIGYRQALAFLEGNQSEDDWQDFVDEFKKVSRKFVRKQFTWFKKEPFFRWLNLSEIDLERAKEYILQDFEQGF